MNFAMGTLLTPCKDSEGTAHVACSSVAHYTNMCSSMLLRSCQKHRHYRPVTKQGAWPVVFRGIKVTAELQ